MVLAGQEYCLIRQEFTQNQVPKRVYPEVAQKILITMGGADPGNDSGKIIGVLELLASQNSGWQPVIAVTAGGANPHVTLLQKQISESNLNIELHINTAEMFELMTWCDLAISSGGGTVWELCYTGTPAAIGMIADPEKGMLDIVATTKHAQSLGDLRGATTKTIAELLNPVIKSVELRKSYSEKSKKMIDGLGATRVAKTLLEKV
jgi:spore coat polysaccharide biosynthesis predicted glycosyltransferase SpsG